jgi:DNA-binding CsgD family transcriptional regulator
MSFHHSVGTIEPLTESVSFTPVEWDQVVDELNMSPRQADVVRLILAGKRDKQIAIKLGMSLPTVRTHLRIIFSRLDVKDRVELVLSVFAVLRASKVKA